MIGLEDEFSAVVCSLTPERIDVLRAAGVHDGAIFHDPLMVGMARIQTHRGGLYDIAADGDLAVLLPAGAWDGLNWQIDDLIAFKPAEPGRWWRRLGEVKILGSSNIRTEPVFPLTLYDTPLSWLQAGARGVCVIDWRVDPEKFTGPIVAESRSLKARFEQRIQSAALAKSNISVSEVIENAA